MSPDGGSQDRRILVLDGDADSRRLIRQTLEEAGYAVDDLASGDGLEARLNAAVRQGLAPDLILCDSLMPGRDGQMLYQSLTTGDATGAIPVVLLAATKLPQTRRAARDLRTAGYLIKPFSPELVVHTVAEALATQTSVRIWGCRGSVAAPERALGRYGGNTSCVELILPGHRHLIFDAGTGIRALGNSIIAEHPLRAAILLTHFHWDHTQGFPFFKPLFQPGNEINVYGPADSNDALVETIEGQMGGKFFPISPEAFLASVKYYGLQEQTFETLGVKISTLYTMHPGATLAYRVEVGAHSIVYAPDDELLLENIAPGPNGRLAGEVARMAEFVAGASLLLHDSQFSLKAYQERRGWGHSCGAALAAVAAQAQVKKTLLFHHDPDSSDADVDAIHEEFQQALKTHAVDLDSEPAREGIAYQIV